MKIYLFALIVLSSFSGCLALLLIPDPGIIVEFDQIKSIKRIKQTFYYRRALEKRSPLISLKQTFLKEIYTDKRVSYRVYDVLSLTHTSFALEDSIYIILNESDIIAVALEAKKRENIIHISEKTEDIISSDSTKVSVVTGYSKREWNDDKIGYKLNSEAIERIDNAHTLQFRYYAGPNMLTVEMKGNNLRDLKKLIHRD